MVNPREHLKALRQRMEMLCKETLEGLSDGMEKGSYSTELIADLHIVLPNAVNERFEELMKVERTQDFDRKVALLEIAVEMRRALGDIDKKIEAAIEE